MSEPLAIELLEAVEGSGHKPGWAEPAFDALRPLLEAIDPFLPWLTLLSVVMALASTVLIPVLVVKMPADYFVDSHRHRRWTVPRALYWGGRNLVALILLLAGLAMMILPGQGLLTILIAVTVSDVPGKYPLERWLLRRGGVLKAINWLRRRYDRPPVRMPAAGGGAESPPAAGSG